jgi:hypothetical protein
VGPTLSSLVTASLLLGQTAGAPATPPSTGGVVVPAPVVEQPRSTSKFSTWRQDRPILSRIQGWFGKKDTAEPGVVTGNQTVEPPTAIPQATTPALTPKGNDFPRKLPNPNNLGQPTEAPPAKTLQSVTFQKPVAATGSTTTTVVAAPTAGAASPILPSLVDKIGRDEKFEWITGQYEIEKGQPVLYYATPETVDPHKGRVALQPQQADLSKLQRGDLISVRGQLSTTGGSAVYRLTSADLIERPKR